MRSSPPKKDEELNKSVHISPLLFITHMEELMRCFKERYKQTGEGDTMALLYADDSAVWSNVRRGLEEPLVRLNSVLTDATLRMSVQERDNESVWRGRRYYGDIEESRGIDNCCDWIIALLKYSDLMCACVN